MLHEQVHDKIIKNCEAVESWFESRSKNLELPFYSSYDIRDSGEKIAPVDANLFPAGFNNICQQDKDSAVSIIFEQLSLRLASDVKKIYLLAEEHTDNAYYWENIKTIIQLIEKAGFEVCLFWPRLMTEPFIAQSSSGSFLTVYGSELRNGYIEVDGQKADFVLCNNDFSVWPEGWPHEIRTPIQPAVSMGWHRRRKNNFFSHYNKLASELAEIIQVDPERLTVMTQPFEHFDVEDEESRKRLAQVVAVQIEQLQEQYKKLNIDSKPFVFVKNSAGTYGLGVIKVDSPDEILNWSYKSRKKLKAAKGGRDVESLIIQEGIPTRWSTESETAEPCIYMVGPQCVGGFLRAHSRKSTSESLNSPGAVYKKLCMSDLQIKVLDCPMENVYGWLSRLSILALAYEAKTTKEPLD